MSAKLTIEEVQRLIDVAHTYRAMILVGDVMDLDRIALECYIKGIESPDTITVNELAENNEGGIEDRCGKVAEGIYMFFANGRTTVAMLDKEKVAQHQGQA